MVRARIHFCGTVQGVGFRYTTLSFARQSLLTGWVKNLSDGSVEIIVEGPREKIEGLLSRLEEQFGSFIRDRHVECELHEEFFDLLADADFRLKARLLLVGDIDQLPSVGPGMVLRHLELIRK